MTSTCRTFPFNILSYHPYFILYSSYCKETHSSIASEDSSSSCSPKKKCRRRLNKPEITVPEMQSPEKQPRHLRLSQPQYLSGDSTSSNQLCHVRRSCEESYFSQQDFEQEDIHQIETENDESKQAENTYEASIPQDVNINPQSVKLKPSVDGVLIDSPGMSTENSVQIPNAQPQKHQQIVPPRTESSAAETEETYVEYCVSHVQGSGDNPQETGAEPRPSVDGAYSLVVNTLKLSTV